MPAQTQKPEIPLLGQLVIPGQNASALPLKKTLVTAQITGPIAIVSVTQQFCNLLQRPLELEYLFPLPHEAALMGFEIIIGLRTLHGDLQELKKAQEAFQEAREGGQQAGLLKQHRPNLFSLIIANVLPGENLSAVLRYQERLGFDNGQFEFVFPMGITPKYHADAALEESQGVDAPLASSEEPIGPVEVFISIDAGFPVSDPSSPSHVLSSTRLDERRFAVQLGSSAIPDHDFVLRYRLTQQNPAAAGWCSEGENGHYFLATLVPPSLEEDPAGPPPREFVFVFDRSGSMSGEPIDQARNALRSCLRILNPEDTFYILFFDDQMEWFHTESSSVSQEAIDAADQYLASIAGRGGTEILRALDEAMSLPRDAQGRSRYIVFLTDGAISAEEPILEEIRRRLHQERIFTFGIGPSVNRALLLELAHLSRGMAEFLQLNEDIEGAIIRFQDRVSYPLLTDITIQFEHCKVWDVYPSRLPDLYTGQPLELVGRLKLSGKTTPSVRIQARRNGSPATIEVDLPLGAPDDAILRLWAHTRLNELIERFKSQIQNPKLRDEIISLALEYQLVTPFTAFVAVDSEVVLRPGEKAKFIQVAQPLPQGLDIIGFMDSSGKVMSMMTPPPPNMVSTLNMPLMPSPVHSAKSRRLAEGSPTKADYANAQDNQHKEGPAGPLPVGEILRLLARTQNLNGSWNNDLETTAAALLAFVRQGNSPQTGLYRRQLHKAIDWLRAQPLGSNFSDFVRAIALHELAILMNSVEMKQLAQSNLAQLPDPSNKLEQAALQAIYSQISQTTKMKIVNADDLRQAGLLRIRPILPLSLPIGMPEIKAQAWMACI
jgi:Ca-activated chloride channel family protein